MVYSSSFILILFFILAYNNPSHSQKTIELPESKKLMLDYRLSKAIESEDYLEELSIYLQQGSESSGIYQLLLDSILIDSSLCYDVIFNDNQYKKLYYTDALLRFCNYCWQDILVICNDKVEMEEILIREQKTIDFNTKIQKAKGIDLSLIHI